MAWTKRDVLAYIDRVEHASGIENLEAALGAVDGTMLQNDKPNRVIEHLEWTAVKAALDDWIEQHEYDHVWDHNALDFGEHYQYCSPGGVLRAAKDLVASHAETESRKSALQLAIEEAKERYNCK